MYQHIVVGTDGSKRALDAVRAAGRLVELTGATELHVVTASEAYSDLEMSRIRAELPDEYRSLVSPHLEADSRFSEARSVLSPSVQVTTHEVSGDPADGILAVADEVDADLVVVGARGLGTVERFLRGSVSTKVAHHSHCDVLIVEHDN